MNKQELRTNKQELISKYELLRNSYNFDVVAIDGIISDLKRLDEPQKPVVSQMVADWIDKVGNKLFGLNYDSVPSEIYDWVYGEEGNLKKLHLACAIGYEIEKEKRYRVNMFGLSNKNCCLIKNLGLYKFGCETDGNSKHTRKELEEAGFSWVFSCEGVEIEEVE